MSQFQLNTVWLFALLTLLAPQTYGATQLVPSPERIPPTYFGMHIHHAADMTPWPAVPIGSWRLWDARVSWPQLEPKKGEWNFRLLDRYLSLAQEHGTQVLLPLGLSPQWASSRPQEKSVYQPGNAAEPANEQDWQDYAAAVAQHCKGRVRAYEIWNEPNSKEFWTGTTREMVTLTQEAADIIHRIDPSAYVVSPAATTNSGLGWLTEFLNLGGGKYVDVIAYHFYVAPQQPEAMVPLIRKVRQIMSDAGVGEKPLWNTESGWQAPKPFPSPEIAAGYLARAYVLNWEAGVSRLFWYAWDNHSFATLQTTEGDNQTPTPAGRAYGIVQKWLVGAEMNSCAEDANHTWVCHLTRDGVPLWIIWNATENTAEPRSFLFPQNWNDKSVTPLLGEPEALSGPNLKVGPMPEFVSSSLAH